MRINNVPKTSNIQNKEEVKASKINTSTKQNVVPAAVFEKSKSEDKGHVYDRSTIDKLKKDSDKSYESLKRLVDTMIRRQGKALNFLNSNDVIQVDESARAEANELISLDGPLGVEAMSDNIVDFAIAVSGGDKSKLETLRNAIDKGFREAERILGTLPKISLDTYDRIMDKLNKWENE